MGLDGIELMMEVEEEFGITISDAEAAKLRTVGDLVALCLDRIQAAHTVRCPSLPYFLSLRRLVREICNAPVLKMRPRDRVEACLEKSKRYRLWQRLPELLGTTPLQLRRPSWLRKLLVLAVLALPVFCMTLISWSAEMLVMIAFATFVFGITLNWLTIGFRSRTPKGYKTFGDITQRLVGLDVATNPTVEDDYESILSIVKRLVSEQLGVDDEEVIPTARFVEDLGVG